MLSTGNLNAEAEREVFYELNGQGRTLYVQDKEAAKDVITRPKAIAGNPNQVGALMPGEILELKVKEGDKVQPKQTLFVLCAMKMEMNVDASKAGIVKKIHLNAGEKVQLNDLVIEIE